jgi:hypothetical protein
MFLHLCLSGAGRQAEALGLSEVTLPGVDVRQVDSGIDKRPIMPYRPLQVSLRFIDVALLQKGRTNQRTGDGIFCRRWFQRLECF